MRVPELELVSLEGGLLRLAQSRAVGSSRVAALVYRCSFQILRFRRRKRAHTRSGTAAICPFKSIRRGTVLVALETGWQIGDGALIAEDHGHDLTGVRPAAEAVACALVVQDTEQDEGSSSRSDPPEMKAEVMRGWRLVVGKRRRGFGAE